MKTTNPPINRRSFLKKVSTVGAFAGLIPPVGITAAAAAPAIADPSVFVIGPLEGYTAHIGTLVSMLNYNRYTIERMVYNMTMAELDYLHDPAANTIGALLMHLGATEKYYQINTFEGRQDFNDQEAKEWGAAMSLGEEGRKQLKGHDVQYYLERITAVRKHTLAEFKKKDDKWLMAIDPEWSKEQPLNTYWKWFHVCEHEANHRGQIAFLTGRLPGAKAGKE